MWPELFETYFVRCFSVLTAMWILQDVFVYYFYLSKIQLSLLLLVWNGCQYVVIRDPQPPLLWGMRVWFQRRMAGAAVPSDVLCARTCGRRRSWQGNGQDFVVSRALVTLQELSGNLNLLRLDAGILASIQGGILALAESSSWSVHRSQRRLVRLR